VDVTADVVTYTSLLNLHVKREDVAGAHGVMEAMREAGVTATVVTYTSLLNLHVKRKDVAGAHGVMEAMREAGVTATVVTYTSLLNLYVKLHDLKEVKCIMEEMKTHRVKPNEVTYRTLAKIQRQGTPTYGMEIDALIDAFRRDGHTGRRWQGGSQEKRWERWETRGQGERETGKRETGKRGTGKGSLEGQWQRGMFVT
jgi:pentatricopeptide repeat protein